MTAEAVPSGDRSGTPTMSIGEVLGRLRPEFPDVTISKIRFLESEGLVEPQRSSSGYRKFSAGDLERLRWVLSAQRDRYLPLRVIKEQLEAHDRGGAPARPAVSAVAAPESPQAGATPPADDAAAPAPTGAAPTSTEPAAGSDAVPEVPEVPAAESLAGDASEVRFSRDELGAAAGLSPEELDALEQYGLVAPRPGTRQYDGDALLVARTVAELSRYGIEPRHLRQFTSAADREAGLVEQVVAPMRRQRNPQSRAQAEQVARDLGALSVRLHVALLRSRLRPGAAR